MAVDVSQGVERGKFLIFPGNNVRRITDATEGLGMFQFNKSAESKKKEDRRLTQLILH